MAKASDDGVRAWQVVLLIFLPFVGGWFLVRPGKPRGAQYVAVAYCALIGLLALFSNIPYDILGGMLYLMLCILPILYFLDNKVIEKRALRKAQSEELDARVKEIIATEPRLMSEDERLEALERKYS